LNRIKIRDCAFLISAHRRNDGTQGTIGPSVTALQETLPVESALTLVWVATKRQPGIFQAELAAARLSTDKYVPAVHSAVMKVSGLINPKAVSLMYTFVAELADLGRIRAAVDSGAYDTVAAFNAYNAISTAEIRYFQNASATSDPTLGAMTQSAIAEARAQEAMGGAVALIEGAIASGGMMPQPERMLFAQVVGQQNMLTGDTFSLADPGLTAVFNQIYSTPAYRTLQALETQIEASPVNVPIPVNGAAFQLTAQAIQKNVLANGSKIGVLLSSQSTRLRDSVMTELILAAGLGLVAVVASVFVMVRFGRRLRDELGNLYESVREMANERLPRVVERLGRGEDVDVQAESPPPQAGRITEIADVAQAFSTVQRTAVEAAVGQASLRKSVNQVFVNLSLRTQSLLHRQLGMLDSMERATSDPAVLADLFRLDHLTTRMRRHAEGLLILAGTTPGRGWRDPVPAADVLQAAIAEVEDYVRVDVITESADAVAGIAVNDVIHLIAELVENATAFSPPTTRVTISGGVVAQGFAVEIEGPRPWHGAGRHGRRQRAPGQPARVRPGQQRAARPVRGRPARRQARDQGGAATFALWRNHGHRAASPADHRARARGRCVVRARQRRRAGGGGRERLGTRYRDGREPGARPGVRDGRPAPASPFELPAGGRPGRRDRAGPAVAGRRQVSAPGPAARGLGYRIRRAHRAGRAYRPDSAYRADGGHRAYRSQPGRGRDGNRGDTPGLAPARPPGQSRPAAPESARRRIRRSAARGGRASGTVA
jgi:signal transduction histidine kinase